MAKPPRRRNTPHPVLGDEEPLLGRELLIGGADNPTYDTGFEAASPDGYENVDIEADDVPLLGGVPKRKDNVDSVRVVAKKWNRTYETGLYAGIGNESLLRDDDVDSRRYEEPVIGGGNPDYEDEGNFYDEAIPYDDGKGSKLPPRRVFSADNPIYGLEEDDDDSVPRLRRQHSTRSSLSHEDEGYGYVDVAPDAAQSLQTPRVLSPAIATDAELRKKLNDLARAIMDRSKPSDDNIVELVKLAKFSPAELASLNLDAAKLAAFVSAAQSGGRVSDTHAAAVGFKKGMLGDQNQIEWVSNPSADPLKFLHQRLLLASTSDQVKEKVGDGISKVKQDLRQVGGKDKPFGLQKAYDDISNNSNLTWIGLGLDARFEDGIHRRYQELAAKPRRKDTKDPKEALEYLSYNQFAAFIRKAIEHDEGLPARYKAEMDKVVAEHAILSADREDLIDNKAALVAQFDEEQVRKHFKELSENIDDLEKKHEALGLKRQRAEADKAKFADLKSKSDMELSALVGSKGNARVDFEGNFDRGLDGMGRYSLLFLRMMEDNGDLIASAIKAHENGAFKDRLLLNPDFAKDLKEDRSLIFDLNEEEFACLVDAVENRSVSTIEVAERGRQGKILVPLKEMIAARKRLVKSLDPQEEPEWWTHEKIKLFQAGKETLKTGDEAAKRALLQAYINLDPAQRSAEFNAALAAPGITPQGQLEALKAEYDRQIAKLEIIGAYKFVPLALQSTDVDLNVQNVVAANLHSRDGDRAMYIKEMKGDQTISLDGGLVFQVYNGNEGFDKHSKQFEALSEVKFTGKPICSIARFDGRDPGDGLGTRSDYCIVTVTSQNTTKTFISAATFEKIAEQNAADYKRYATHLTKQKGLQEILDIMYVSLADITAKGEIDAAKSLAKEAEALKRFLSSVSFSEDDTVEEREAKIDRFNRFPEDKLKRQTDELKKLQSDAFPPAPKRVDPKDIERLNRWLVDNSVEGVVFDGNESPAQINAKIKMAEASFEQNKGTIFNVSTAEIAESGRKRIADIESKMLSGKEISAEAKKEAQAYSSHATNNHLSKLASKQLFNNHFRIHLDSHQIEKMMSQYGSKDGHLWMKGTDKKDFESLLRAALPVSPVPGGVSIVKPRLGDKDYIRFADPSKNNSNGGPNFAQVTFAADADGNFTGDDIAFICLPGTNNIYIKAMVARQDGTMKLPDGKEVLAKKGDVKIFEGYVFHKNKDGSYDTISTDPTNVTTSDLTKHFGKAKGNDIREIAANFSVVASSVIGTEPCAVAVSFNGKTCESRKLVKARLAPVRDPNDQDRNISTMFEVDAKGRYLTDLKAGDRPHTPHPDYQKHTVIAQGASEMRAFYGNNDVYHQMESHGATAYCIKPFKIALRVCVIEDAKGNQSFAKELVVETFDAKGKPHYKPLKEGLEEVTTDEFDRTALISEMETLAKKADVVVGVKGPDGTEATSILESTDDRWFKAGLRSTANAVLRTAINLTVIGRVVEAAVGKGPLTIPQGEKHNSPDDLKLKQVRSDSAIKTVVNRAADVLGAVTVLPATVEAVAKGVFGKERPRFRDGVTLSTPTGVCQPAISVRDMGPELGLGPKGRGGAASAA